MAKLSDTSIKILSFDVGIKNLAYCLMEKTDNNIKILKWEIINLVEDRNLCQFVFKNKRVCGKIGRFTCSRVCTASPEENNNMKDVVVCNSHKNNYIPTEVESNNFNCNHNKCRNKSSINLMNKQEWSWCELHKKYIKTVLKKFKHKK